MKGRWNVFWSNADRPTMRYDILGFTPTTGQWRNSKDKADIAVANYKKFQEEFEDKMTLEEYYKKTGISDFIRRIPNGRGKNGGVQHWIAPSDTMLRTSNWTDIEVSQIGKEIDVPFDNPKSKSLMMELIKLCDLNGTEGTVLDFSLDLQQQHMRLCNLTLTIILHISLYLFNCLKNLMRSLMDIKQVIKPFVTLVKNESVVLVRK